MKRKDFSGASGTRVPQVEKLCRDSQKLLLEVGAADEVAEMYTFHRTYVMTYSTPRTLIIVNYSKIILDLNRSIRAGLLALAAADTAIKAYLANLCALVVA